MSLLSRILLVEDDHGIAVALAQALQSDYVVDTAATGQMALYKTDTTRYDLIILDLNLPDMPGIYICQQLRERGLQSPILILSAESGVLTKINLLDIGADDYLTKPFSLGELKARMRSLLRNSRQAAQSTPQLVAGNLILNRQSYSVNRDGHEISLRRKEFAILECLMEHAGAVVTRQMLVKRVWQEEDTPWTNTIDVHIKYLRDKIDRPFESQLIRTVHGYGYRLDVLEPALIEAA